MADWKSKAKDIYAEKENKKKYGEGYSADTIKKQAETIKQWDTDADVSTFLNGAVKDGVITSNDANNIYKEVTGNKNALYSKENVDYVNNAYKVAYNIPIKQAETEEGSPYADKYKGLDHSGTVKAYNDLYAEYAETGDGRLLDELGYLKTKSEETAGREVLAWKSGQAAKRAEERGDKAFFDTGFLKYVETYCQAFNRIGAKGDLVIYELDEDVLKDYYELSQKEIDIIKAEKAKWDNYAEGYVAFSKEAENYASMARNSNFIELEQMSFVSAPDSDKYDENYESYVEKGKALAVTEFGKEWTYTTSSRGNYLKGQKIDAYKAVALVMAERDGYKIPEEILKEGSNKDLIEKYRNTTNDELNAVAYYIAKDKEIGGKQAYRYVDLLEDAVMTRHGTKRADETTGFWGNFALTADAGLEQFEQGIERNFDDKYYYPVTSAQVAVAKTTEDLRKEGRNFAAGAMDFGVAAFNMAPSILVSTALSMVLSPAIGALGAAGTTAAKVGAKALSYVPKIAGATTMGLSARGNAYAQMVNQGYSKEQADAYGNMVMVSEIALESVLGGISKFGGISPKVAKAISKVDNVLARLAIQYPAAFGGEFAEEGLQAILEPIFKEIALGYDTGEEIDWEQVAYEALLGGVMGGFFESPEIISSNSKLYFNDKATGKKINLLQNTEALIEQAKNDNSNKSNFKKATKIEKSNKNTDTKVGALFRHMVEDGQITKAEAERLVSEGLDGAPLSEGEQAYFYAGASGLSVTEAAELNSYLDVDPERAISAWQKGAEIKNGKPKIKVDRSTIEDAVIKNEIKREGMQGSLGHSTQDIEKSFGIENLRDYINVQKNVRATLVREGFFNKKSVVNKESGATIEINWSGIKETLGSGNNFQYLSVGKKKKKLAVLRELHSLIEKAKVTDDNFKNYHKENSSLQYMYLEAETEIDGEPVIVKIDIRKAPQKNQFWVHQIYTKETVSVPAGTSEGSITGFLEPETASPSTIPQKKTVVKRAGKGENYRVEAQKYRTEENGKEFDLAYSLGLTGEEITGLSLTNISDDARIAAYFAGKRDARVLSEDRRKGISMYEKAGSEGAMSFSEFHETMAEYGISEEEGKRAYRRGAARRGDSIGKESHGLSRDPVTKARLSEIPEQTAEFLNEIGKRSGTIIKIANVLYDEAGKRVRGVYVRDGNTITISASALKSGMTKAEVLRFLGIHELVHRIRDINKKGYMEMSNYALEYSKKSVDDYMKRGYSREDAIEELTADFFGEMLADEAALKAFIGKKRNLAEVLRDVLRKVIAFFKGEELPDFKKALSILNKALDGADTTVGNVLIEEGDSFTRYGEYVKKSRAEKVFSKEIGDAIDSFYSQLNDWVDGKGKPFGSYNGEYFDLGETSDILIKYGATESPLIMINEEVAKVSGGKHAIAFEELAYLPFDLSEPILLFKSTYKDKYNNERLALVALTEIFDKNGNDVIAAVHINVHHGRNIVNKVSSAYSKSDEFGNNKIISYVQNQIERGNLLYADEKKAPIWFTTKGLQLPNVVQTIIDANNNLPQKSGVVNSNSMQEKIKYSREEDDFYTEEEYRNYGWARANGILNAAQNEDYRSKFADAVANKFYYPKSKNGEWIIPVRDSSNPNFKDIENVLVFAKGKIDKPVITSIIEIYEYEETEIDKVRRYIYDLERKGIQPEIRGVINRYYADDFKDKRQGAVSQNSGYNNDNGLRRRNSEEASTVAGEKIKYSREEDDFYTEEEYRNYGWARANGILNAAQNEDYRSKFADAVANKFYYPKSKNGEWIIPVRDSSDPNFKDIENVLVFAKGTIDKPVITSIIEIYEYEESEVDKVRRNIYELERRGIQQKTGEAVGRYYAYSSGIKHYREYIEGRGYNNDNGLGRGNSEEASTVAGEKIKYSREESSEAVKYLPPGEKRAREVKIIAGENGKKTSQFVRTAAEAEVISDSISERIVEAANEGLNLYSPEGNKTMVNNARHHIDKVGFDAAMAEWQAKSDSAETAADKDIVRGIMLLERLAREGREAEAVKLAGELAAELTILGRAIQSASILKCLNGAGQLVYTEKQIRKMEEQARKNIPKSKLSKIDEKLESIERLREEVKTAEDNLKTAEQNKRFADSYTQLDGRIFELSKEISELEAEIKNSEESQELRDMLSEAYKERRALKKQQDLIANKILAAEGRISELTEEGETLLAESRRAERDLEAAREKEQFSRSAIKSYEKQLEALKKRTEKSEGKSSELIGKIAALEATLEMAKSEYEDIKSKVDLKRKKLDSLNGRLETLLGSERRIGRIEHLRNKNEAILAFIETAQEKLDAAKKDMEAAKGINTELTKLEDEVRKYGVGLYIPDELKEALIQAKEPEEIEAAINDIYRFVAQQIPATKMEKWNAWRYVAMLANPRTHVRNTLGNAAMSLAIFEKNILGATAESMLSFAIKDRTKTLSYYNVFSKEAMAKKKAFKNMADSVYAEMEKFIKSGGKYEESRSEILRENRTIFRLRWLEAIRKFNSKMLDREDGWFLKPHFKAAYASYCLANGYNADTITEEQRLKAFEYATKEAQRATFREASDLAAIINKSGKLGTAVKAVQPFINTPVNVAKQSVRYSPLGLINTVYDAVQDARKGDGFSTSKLIDNLSMTLTGTGIAVAGYMLAKAGLLRGSEDDEEKAAIEKAAGHQNYAIEVNGVSYTLDWANPAAVPLFFGVELFNLSEKHDLSGKKLISAVFSSINPFYENSFLTSLKDILDAAQNLDDAEGLTAMVIEGMLGYVSQGVPTFLGQVARSIDPYTRSTYSNGELPSYLSYAPQQIKNRIPGLSMTSPKRVDVWGKTEKKETVMDYALAVFENMLSPGYFNKIYDDAVHNDRFTRELLEVSEGRSKDSSSVKPKVFDKKIEQGDEAIYLTGEEWEKASVVKGETAEDLIKGFMGYSLYGDLDYDEKAEIISDIYKYATEKATDAIGYDVENPSKMYEMEQLGIAPEDYILFDLAKAKVDADENQSYKQEEIEEAIRLIADEAELTEEEKAVLWQNSNKSWKSKNNPWKKYLPREMYNYDYKGR